MSEPTSAPPSKAQVFLRRLLSSSAGWLGTGAAGCLRLSRAGSFSLE